MGYRGQQKGSHGNLRVRRASFHRKGYTRRDGTYVKPAEVPSTTFTIKDRGKKGRGKKVIPVRKGRMQGYSISMSDQARHKKLDKLVNKYGAGKVWHMLHAQVILRARTQPHARKIFAEDRNYIRDNFKPDVAKYARHKWMRMSPRQRARAMPGGKI